MIHKPLAISELSARVSAYTCSMPAAASRPMKVAVIGTYAPRRCGIATFTQDLVTKVGAHFPQIAFDIYALENDLARPGYDARVTLVAQDDPEAYRAAARAINRSGVDAVWLQHEYGIFGGPDGALVHELVDRLAVPLITTFHTILSDPSPGQERVLAHILERTSQVMVMSRHGRDLLCRLYGTPGDRVSVIAHGAPDRPFGRSAAFKAARGLAGREVLMTFGLIGPGKGLEHAIDALPAIAARHPQVLYRIVGATHPSLLREQGEAYREALQARVAALGMEYHVEWDDRFLETDELLDQLEACDVYLTPYPNLQQSTSGTLSYAVALGKAVVSTPYIHARELLAGGVGCLVPPGEPAAIAERVDTLLRDPARLEAVQMRAYEAGRSTIWPEFAAAGAGLIAAAADMGAGLDRYAAGAFTFSRHAHPLTWTSVQSGEDALSCLVRVEG